MKYIDADKLIAEIYKRREDALSVVDIDKANNLIEVIELIEDLQQEQPIRGHHTESWIEETKQELQHEEELLDMRLETLKRIRDKKNQFQQEQPLTTEKVVEQCKKFGGNPEIIQQEQPEVDLEKSRNLIRTTLNGVTRLGSLCDDQTIEHAVDNLIDKLGLNARKEE